MKLIRSKKLINNNVLYTGVYNGIFGFNNFDSFFVYGDTPNIMIIEDKDDSPKILASVSCPPVQELPRNWMIIKSNDRQYLMCDKSTCIEISEGVVLSEIPLEILTEYNYLKSIKKNYDLDSFNFDKLTIEHYGNWGYCCKQNEVIKWVFNGRAYLYTNIMRFHDHLYFGTAGAGGYFYILNINTGEPILSLKTGGTAYIETLNNFCYVLTCGNRPELVSIDLSTGIVLDRLILPGKSTVDSCLKIINNKIFVVTFCYTNKKQLLYALLNEVEIKDRLTIKSQ